MYGITWDDACIVFDSMEWANELYFLRAREDMLQLMRALIAVGVEVVCITARGACDVYPSHMSTVRDATDMWLRANDMHVRVVHALDKAAYMVAEGGYIAIFDDAAHTRAACAAVGIAAFMP
jgi:hypothetical protein